MEVYHLSRLSNRKDWTIRETAEYFDVSIGLVSENLRLAKLIHTYPNVIKMDSRQKALKALNKAKWMRKSISEVAARSGLIS